MSRIIALDYGQKRIGIAVSDPLQLMAAPLKIVPTREIIPFLKSYLQKETVESIVVGWPLQLDGTRGNTAQLVEQFIRSLRRHFRSIPVLRCDERFTSKLAKQSILQMGLPAQKRKKKRIDDVSATFILRSFMESTVWRQRNNVV